MANSSEKVLNEEQLEAVRYGNGPLLIIAGAGTGKTTVITERIKWLVFSGKAKPSEILALTFTEKAAREMEERVDVAMPYGYTQMWISTFHAFCDRILRQEALNIGLTSRYNLLTESETIQFLRQNLFKFNLRYFRPLGNPNKFLEGMLQHFNRLKDEDVGPNQYLDWAKSQITKSKFQKEEAEKYLELAQAFQRYEELKSKEGFMDFADLIAYTLKLFRTKKNILAQYQRQFKYILVDEFQDTNYAQYALLKVLAPPKASPNLTVVADDSQSIYKFRGAAVSNILQFIDEYKDAKNITLTKNYRSAQIILDQAYQLIKHNDPDTLEVKLGISKNLIATRKVEEIPIEFLHADRVENEAELVVKKILELTSARAILKYEYKDIAILVRANNHADPFIRALVRAGVPHQFLGPGMLFHQSEVKDLIAYLKVLANFEDSVAMYRVLGMDLFEISPRDLATLVNYAKRKNLSLLEACEKPDQVFLNQKTKLILEKIVVMVNRHIGLIKKETAGQILYYFLEDSGLLQKMTEYNTSIEERRAQNISKFFDKLKTYEVEHQDASVYAVSDWIDLAMELGESPLAADIDWTDINAVNILTVHSAKGLEFPVVFLINLVQQRFPTTERREPIPIPQELIKEILPIGDYHLEEERRLFYVGMTRAKDRLFLTAADYYGEGKRERKISPFVIEALGEGVLKRKKGEEPRQLSILEWQGRVEESGPIIVDHKIIVDYLSYSQIEAFRRCPLHYKLKFIIKIPTPHKAGESFGTSMHAALRDFYRAKIAGERLGEKDLFKFLERNWIDEGYSSKSYEKKNFERGKRYLHGYWQKHKDPKLLPVATEQPFMFKVKNLKVGGRIDWVDQLGDGTIEIIDYKTSEKTPTPRDIAKDLQMTIYALAATEVTERPFGRKPEDVSLSFYFFESSKKMTTTRTKEQLEEAKKEILDWAKKISESDFKCTSSEFCKHCEYRLLCDSR